MILHYAVNIADLTKDSYLGPFLIAPLTKGRQIVQAEKTIDGSAVVLNCGRERVKAIIDVIRLRYGKSQMRFYESKTGQSWKRI